MGADENESEETGMSERKSAMKSVETVDVRARVASTSLKRGVNESVLSLLLLLLLLFSTRPLNATDTLRWRTNSVSADIKATELTAMLEKIASVTK